MIYATHYPFAIYYVSNSKAYLLFKDVKPFSVRLSEAYLEELITNIFI